MDQIEDVKSKTDIVDVIGQYVQLKRAGRNYKGLCPFHGEKSPSFMVNPELQIFKCFGCQEGGDAFSFLQKIEGMEFGEALQSLAKKVGVELVSYRPTQGEQLKEKLLDINTLSTEVYHYMLTKHKLGNEALAYVMGRGITLESVEKFRIGFAPNSWDFLVKFLVDKKKYTLDIVRKTGLVVEGKSYDRFRNRIMFPLANMRGRVVGFAGRVMPGADEKSGGKYVNTPETEIYHKGELLYGYDVTRGEIKSMGTVVVVEGEVDMIASWQAGVKNTVAIKGSALTVLQVELLRRVCDTMILGLDTDVAGDMAARRGIEIAQKAGLFVKVIDNKTKYKDPGEMAVADPEVWKKTVREAIPVYDFYIQSAVGRYGMDTQGKTRIGREVIPVLVSIEDEILKSEYVQKLARVLGVDEIAVRQQMAKTIGVKNAVVGPNKAVDKKGRREVVEEYVVALALRGGRVDELVKEPIGEWIKTPIWRKIVDALRVDPDVKKVPAELRSRLEDLLFLEGEYDEQEWNKAKMELEEVETREKIEEIKDKEDGGDEVRELARRLSELTRGK